MTNLFSITRKQSEPKSIFATSLESVQITVKDSKTITEIQSCILNALKLGTDIIINHTEDQIAVLKNIRTVQSLHLLMETVTTGLILPDDKQEGPNYPTIVLVKDNLIHMVKVLSLSINPEKRPGMTQLFAELFEISMNMIQQVQKEKQ